MIFKSVLIGIAIGFMASMPIGPINILVIHRTVRDNRLSGFCSGIGAAVSDTVYAAVAGFSLSFIIEFIRTNELYIKIGGSVVLIILGAIIFFNHKETGTKIASPKPNLPIKNIVTTFLLTFTNPLVIFLHMGIFAGWGIVLDLSMPQQAISILVGFFMGAILWWFALTGIISLFRNKINTKTYRKFNKVAGAGIVIIVLVSLAIALIGRVGFMFTG